MKLSLHSPLDMHLHFREGDMLDLVAPLSAEQFAGGVIMPNLVSPVDSLEKLQLYQKEIVRSCHPHDFTPLMTLFFRNYSRQELTQAREHIIGVKLYPAGVTTQSEQGVSDFSGIEQTLALLEELAIPLLVHGETDGFVLDREQEFLLTFDDIARNFPELHIVMEHITTEAAVRFLDKYPNISATVTLHHLIITLDDVAGNLLAPDLFCKPIAKRPQDREALREAVFSGHPKLFFGSDSAPHPRHKKECVGCAAGVFTAPVALPLLAQLFAEEGKIELLENFAGGHARKRYGIQPFEKVVTLEEKSWRVPERYGDVRPFFAGREISWSLC